eukprot:107570-Rhodomonas_salina.1
MRLRQPEHNFKVCTTLTLYPGSLVWNKEGWGAQVLFADVDAELRQRLCELVLFDESVGCHDASQCQNTESGRDDNTVGMKRWLGQLQRSRACRQPNGN